MIKRMATNGTAFSSQCNTSSLIVRPLSFNELMFISGIVGHKIFPPYGVVSEVDLEVEEVYFENWTPRVML